MKLRLKLFLTILVLFYFIGKTWGQVNSVLNYSFEQHINCAQIGNCTGSAVTNWYCPSATYINWFSFPCSGSSGTGGVPQNLDGYQYAKTGQCYAGFEPIGKGNIVAYITGTLSDSLKPNQKYCVTFYVSLADSEWWATNSIGAYFSNDSICSGNNFNVLPYIPQIENPLSNFLTDKIDWVPISGEYQANGGEKFITIGCFYHTTLSDFDSVGHGGRNYDWYSEVQSAYYVDDVYVRMLTIANAGKEDTICNGDGVTIGKDTTTTGVSFHWLPTTGLSNPNIAQPLASPTVTTTYTLTVVNDSVHGCNCADSVTKDSVTVFVYPAMNITNYFINDTGSNSGSAGVYVTDGSQPYTYLWKPNGQTTDSITGLGASIDTCIITDANGCTYTTKIVVKNTTGIANVESESISFNLYPNPNNGNYTISYNLGKENTGKVELYNQLGMSVAEYLLNSPIGTMSVSNPNLVQGMYIYKVYTNSGVKKIGKIIIIK